jgi:ABC-2 type transport system permease protein
MNYLQIKTLFLREYWENRTPLIHIPLVVALVCILGAFGGSVVLNFKLEQPQTKSKTEQDDAGYQNRITIFDGQDVSQWQNATKLQHPFKYTPNKNVDTRSSTATYKRSLDKKEVKLVVSNSIAAVFLILGIVSSIVYVTRSLYLDRIDKSILFYRSMPVSESTNVLVKGGIALFVYPLVYLLIGFIATPIITIVTILTAEFGTLGLYISQMEQKVGSWSVTDILYSWGQSIAMLLVLLIYCVPLYSWMLCCSAWAKRFPSLLVLSPLAIIVIEKLIFDHLYLGQMIEIYFRNFWALTQHLVSENYIYIWRLKQFELTASLVLSLIFSTVVFLYAAIWARKFRYETA